LGDTRTFAARPTFNCQNDHKAQNDTQHRQNLCQPPCFLIALWRELLTAAIFETTTSANRLSSTAKATPEPQKLTTAADLKTSFFDPVFN